MSARIYSLVCYLILQGVLGATTVFAQDADPGVAAADTTGTIAGTEGASSLFDAILRTRWFGIAILIVFLVGIFFISMKVYELLQDRKIAADLEGIDIQYMSPDQIAELVEVEQRHMLADIFSTMLNVYQTRKSAATLHDEVSNFLVLKQAQFATFRLRIDFLSDSAGALGLLGTVWGMFIVFNDPSFDKQVILVGMGMALMTTLLGLVVSLILNLGVTEVSSYFNHRLDMISEKADLLRFRLMELAGTTRIGPAVVSSVDDRAPKVEKVTGSADRKRRSVRSGSSATPPDPLPQDSPQWKSLAKKDTLDKKKAKPKPLKLSLELKNMLSAAIAGQALKDVTLILIDSNGDPVFGTQIDLQLTDGNGHFGNERNSETVTTDKAGLATFDWRPGTALGSYHVEASVSGTTTNLTISVDVIPGPPSNVSVEGNNQTCKAGEKLEHPLVVSVLDDSENPLEGLLVSFEVEMGNGTFNNGNGSVETKTDNNGRAAAIFMLDPVPGFNTVSAKVEGITGAFKFHAMGGDK